MRAVQLGTELFGDLAFTGFLPCWLPSASPRTTYRFLTAVSFAFSGTDLRAAFILKLVALWAEHADSPGSVCLQRRAADG